MFISFFTSSGFETAIHAMSSVLAFLATFILSSSVGMNKGAKSNRAWVIIAIGLVLIGLSEAGSFFAGFGLSLFGAWGGVMMLAGLLFILLGVVLWRQLVKKSVS